MDGLTHDDVEHLSQEEDEEQEDRKEGDEEKEEQKQQRTMKNKSTCPMCGITLHTLYITQCTICNVKVPLGDTRKGMLRNEFHNRHRCFCGNKKKLLIAEKSKYYIWDMECFTDPVVVREMAIDQEPMIVREHKPIFVAACNMADPQVDFRSTVRTASMIS
jgi:hypothetical protein